MKKRKILYISGTRADYGLMRQALFNIKKHPRLDIEIAVTGMHLMPQFGRTLNEIKKDKFKIHILDARYIKNDKVSMAYFIGKFVQLLTRKVAVIKPDIILVLGDRAEMLAAAIVGAYLSIPVAHIHGGEVTSTVDEIIRHSISKLSLFHFAATSDSVKRILRMGEDSRRIFKVGAPGLDSILNESLLSKEKIAKKYKIDLSKKILLVIQHPVSIGVEESAKQMKEIMEALKDLMCQAIVVYPNADAGSRGMIKVITRYKRYRFIRIYKHIPRRDYLTLMSVANVLVGNTSSGIIEAPLFHLAFVNIGLRQKGRERSRNIIDTAAAKQQIKITIEKAMQDTRFIKKLKRCKSPYGDGRSGARIADILAKIKLNIRLLQKKITY